MFVARRALLCALLVAAMVGNSIADGDDDDGASALHDLEQEDAKIAQKEEGVEHTLQDDLSREVSGLAQGGRTVQDKSPSCACLTCANDATDKTLVRCGSRSTSCSDDDPDGCYGAATNGDNGECECSSGRR